MKRHTNTLLQHALVADTICTLCSVLAALDLASEPNTGANGVHASAGPLEGAQRRERTLILMISIWNTSGSPPLIFGGLPLSP